jgi:hypothetical protein
MPDTQGRWATTRFADPADLRHDAHVNIVTFQPGGVIPFEETHVMEHGLFVLEGKAVYKLNTDWVEVEAGDFMWLRAFCPQACYAAGPGSLPLPPLQGRQPPRQTARPRRLRPACADPFPPLFVLAQIPRGVRGAGPPLRQASSMRQIRTEPLTATAFAPFGDVLEASGDFRLINAGLCRRHHDRALLDFGPAGRAGSPSSRPNPARCPTAST